MFYPQSPLAGKQPTSPSISFGKQNSRPHPLPFHPNRAKQKRILLLCNSFGILEIFKFVCCLISASLPGSIQLRVLTRVELQPYRPNKSFLFHHTSTSSTSPRPPLSPVFLIFNPLTKLHISFLPSFSSHFSPSSVPSLPPV